MPSVTIKETVIDGLTSGLPADAHDDVGLSLDSDLGSFEPVAQEFELKSLDASRIENGVFEEGNTIVAPVTAGDELQFVDDYFESTDGLGTEARTKEIEAIPAATLTNVSANASKKSKPVTDFYSILEDEDEEVVAELRVDPTISKLMEDSESAEPTVAIPALKELIILHIQTKDYEAVLQCLEEWNKKNDLTSREFLDLVNHGKSLLDAGDYEAAGEIFEVARRHESADKNMQLCAEYLINVLVQSQSAAKARISQLRKQDKGFDRIFSDIASLRDESAALVDGLDNKEDLDDLRVKKSKALAVLANQIELKLTGFIVKLLHPAVSEDKKDENAFKAMQKEIAAEVNAADVVLQQHRQKNAQWRIIAENILIALSGFGLFALIAKAIYVNVKHTKGENTPLLNKYAFFGETASEKKADDLKQSVASTKLSTLTQGA